MRLIDADKLKERLMAKVSGFTYKTIHIDDVVAYIDGSPTVEGESVVRCRDCKWYRLPDEYINQIYCKNMRLIPPQPDDFCSYGEVRDE